MLAHVVSLGLVTLLGAKPVPRIAVLDTQIGETITGIDRLTLTDVLVSSMADPEAWRLVTLRDVGALLSLERNRELLGCTTGSCIAEIAGALGTEGAIVTSVGNAGGKAVVSGRLVRTATGELIAQAAVEVPGMDLTQAMRKLGWQLLRAWRAARGLAPASSGRGADCASAAECEADCTAGSAAGCAKLRALVAEGGPDPLRAAAAFERACDTGDPVACSAGADAFQRSGKPEAAIRLFERACLSLDPDAPQACARGGALLFESAGPLRDPPRALAMAALACRAGVAASCVLEGRLLSTADGVPRNDRRAVEALEAACRAKEGAGCARLAELVGAGRAGPPDAARAVLLHHQACTLSDAAPSCLRAAEGHAAAGDLAKARPLYEKLCSGASAEAAAACVALGAGVPKAGGRPTKDEVRYKRLACEKGAGAPACLEASERALALDPVDLEAAAVALAPGCKVALREEEPMDSPSWPTSVPAVAGPPGPPPVREEPEPSRRERCTRVLGRAVAAARSAPRGPVVLAAACEAGYGPACAEAARSTPPGKDGEARTALLERACRGSPIADCSRRGLALSVTVGAVAPGKFQVSTGEADSWSPLAGATLLLRGELLQVGATLEPRMGTGFGRVAQAWAGLLGVVFDVGGGKTRVDLLAELGETNVRLRAKSQGAEATIAEGTLPFFGLRAGLAFGSGGLRSGIWISIREMIGALHLNPAAPPGTTFKWDRSAQAAGLRLEYEL